MQSARAALDRLCDPAAEVSAHYLVGMDGELFRIVDEDHRAWHAGAGSWQGLGDINSRSVGIELDNDGASPFPEPLMVALETLLSDLLARWSIPPQNVIAHSDMAPGRKTDPGPKFDWRRLARQGLSIWPRPSIDPADLHASLTRIGYPEVDALERLAAFRLRFRPWASGPADATDAALADDLAKRYGVDPTGSSA